MVEIHQEEKQQELFLEFQGVAKRPERFPALAKSHKPILFSTTIEQIILVSIALILVGCFTFFLGVLRGKSLSNPMSHYLIMQRKIQAVTVTAKPEVRAITARNNKVEQIQNTNNNLYTIQLSTYKKQDLAEKEAVILRRSGFYSTIIPSNGYYVVCVGQYATKDAAKNDLKVFSVKYKGCFLRRRS